MDEVKQQASEVIDLTKVYNVAAGRVVNYREMRKKVKAAYAEKLSFGEKVYLYLLSKPMGYIGGLIAELTGVGDKAAMARLDDGTNGFYMEEFDFASVDSVKDVFKNVFDRTYVHVDATLAIADRIDIIPDNPVSRKIRAVFKEAVEDCQDYRSDVESGKLTPYKGKLSLNK